MGLFHHGRAGHRIDFRAHFEPRFPEGRSYELAAYDFTWREIAGEPLPATKLSTYVRARL